MFLGAFRVFEFGCAIKPRFFVSEDIAIKPGLNIGYRTTSSEEEDKEWGPEKTPGKTAAQQVEDLRRELRAKAGKTRVADTSARGPK